MKKINYLSILKIFIIVLTLVALSGLFMPYEKATKDYREELLEYADEDFIPNLEIKNSDVVNLTILENFKIYNYAKDNSEGDDWVKDEATINVVITIVLIVSIILTLLFTILNKHILVIIFDIILAISSLAMNFDITSRGVMPSDEYTCGISFYLFVIVSILILISVIVMKVLKKHPELLSEKNNKKETKSSNKEIKSSNKEKEVSKNNSNIVNYLKQYWYIIVIVILLIIIFVFIFSGNSKDNIENTNNNNSGEVENNTTNNNDSNSNTGNSSNNNSNNNSNITFPGNTQTENKIKYTLVKTLDDTNVIIGQNNNEGSSLIEIEVEFYDKENNFLGSSSDVNLTKGSEFAVELYNSPKTYDHYKAFFDIKKSDYILFDNQLKVTSNDTGDRIVSQINNTTNDEIDYIDASIVYYKDNKVVGYDSSVAGDTKPGRSANFSFYKPYDNNYDDIDFDTYKIFINEAYNYN